MADAVTDSIVARIAELQAHAVQIQIRADREKAAVQQQIDALANAQKVLTPDVVTAYVTLTSLGLLPGARTDG
jgi:hypothetical protein